MSEQIPGILEVDRDRGVIYFHRTDERGAPTLLRICRLPNPIPLDSEFIDVAADPAGTAYNREVKFAQVFWPDTKDGNVRS